MFEVKSMKRNLLFLLGLNFLAGCNNYLQAQDEFQPALITGDRDQKVIISTIKQELGFSKLSVSKKAFYESSSITIDSPMIRLPNGTYTDTRTDTSAKVKLFKQGKKCYLTFNQGRPVLVDGLKCVSH